MPGISNYSCKSVMKDRLDHIDKARGVAILFVVLGHSFLSVQHPINMFILSFHMPLFFFLSGIFAKDYTWSTALNGIKSKVIRLLVPQLVLAATVVVMKAVPLILKGEPLSRIAWWSGLGYWFLPTLFCCAVLFIVLSCLLDMNKWKIRIGVLIFTLVTIVVVLYVFHIPNVCFKKYLKIVPVAFLFYQAGSYSKNFALSSGTERNPIIDIAIIFGFPLLYVLSQLNEPVKMYMNDYGKFPLFLVTSYLGTFLIIEVAKRIKDMQIFAKLGRMSIAIYVWNFLLVGLTRGVLIRVLKKVALDSDGLLVALTFTVSLTLLYVISKITMTHCPSWYGLSRIKD